MYGWRRLKAKKEKEEGGTALTLNGLGKEAGVWWSVDLSDPFSCIAANHPPRLKRKQI